VCESVIAGEGWSYAGVIPVMHQQGSNGRVYSEGGRADKKQGVRGEAEVPVERIDEFAARVKVF